MKEQAFGQRLSELIKHFKLTRAAFARRVSIDRQVIDNFLNGALPRIDNLILIMTAFPGLILEWLTLGQGEMLKDMKGIPGGAKMTTHDSVMDAEIIRKMWEQDRLEIIRLREQNENLTNQLVSMMDNVPKSKANTA